MKEGKIVAFFRPREMLFLCLIPPWFRATCDCLVHLRGRCSTFGIRLNPLKLFLCYFSVHRNSMRTIGSLIQYAHEYLT